MASSEEAKKIDADPTCAPFPLCCKKGSFNEALESVARILEGRRKVMVLAGAGISVSCGIPDFRSKNVGLYSTLDFEVRNMMALYSEDHGFGIMCAHIFVIFILDQELGLSCAEDLFDYDFFQDDPRPFYKFSKCLYFPLGNDKRVEPSDSHRFLALLEKKDQLLRVYTQNIDGLEEVAGVSRKRMVYAHGSLQWASCTRCKQKVDASVIEPSILTGKVPLCTATTKVGYKTVQASSRKGNPRKKRKPFCESNGICGGVLKPGVTFFGETLQDKVRRSLESDREKADCLIVIGTSLSV